MNNEPTTKDILEAINTFSTHVDKRFDGVDERLDMVEGRLDKVEGRLDKVDGRLDKVDGRLDKVDGRLDKVESTMVTKEYLDEKLSDLRGDLVVLTRKEDNKLKKLVEILNDKNILTAEDKTKIFQMEPFAEQR